MSLFRVTRRTPLPPAEVWRRLTDWPAHGAQVPLTRTRVLTPDPSGPGTRFTARTGVGPLAFDDPMEVVRWKPPGEGPDAAGVCRLRKHGRVVTGWAEFEVRAEPGGGTLVVWTEEIGVRGVPRAAGPVLGGAGRFVFGRALDGLLAHRPGRDTR
ncbi:Immediate-early protein 2 [Streptomyces solincola]|uniref:Immediate-early protein 2 n=1 Tax=Streptomyces solincola TaxID=2100817 RepID=A0A2S9PNM9_9ACTN|nr:Immediate-early protein 2 [Streptomyces solincola]PRH76004.1 Immediate-early protein 2 [Streptomyces solincola]